MAPVVQPEDSGQQYPALEPGMEEEEQFSGMKISYQQRKSSGFTYFIAQKQSKPNSTARQLVCPCPALSTAQSITSLPHAAGK